MQIRFEAKEARYFQKTNKRGFTVFKFIIDIGSGAWYVSVFIYVHQPEDTLFNLLIYLNNNRILTQEC